MRTFLPVWVGVASAILSVVWLFIEQVMGISFVGPILDSVILMLAKLFFKSNEAGVVFALPVRLFYPIAVGLAAGLFCRLLLSGNTRTKSHDPN